MNRNPSKSNILFIYTIIQLYFAKEIIVKLPILFIIFFNYKKVKL